MIRITVDAGHTLSLFSGQLQDGFNSFSRLRLSVDNLCSLGGDHLFTGSLHRILDIIVNPL